MRQEGGEFGPTQARATIEVALFVRFFFVNDELLNPNSSDFAHFLNDSRRVPSPWDFSSDGSFVSPNQFLGDILSSQIKESKKKSGAPLS